jgi:hypothetical protein
MVALSPPRSSPGFHFLFWEVNKNLMPLQVADLQAGLAAMNPGQLYIR